MATWAIGEVAAQSGVSASTIRYYEQIELLPPARRVNGRRRYDAAILSQLKMIRLAQQAGFTIAEIQRLVHDFPLETPPSTRWQVLARQKLVELEERLQTIETIRPPAPAPKKRYLRRWPPICPRRDPRRLSSRAAVYNSCLEIGAHRWLSNQWCRMG